MTTDSKQGPLEDPREAQAMDDLFARIESELAGEAGLAGRVRAWPRARAGLLVVGFGLALAGAWFVVSPRPDLHLYPQPRLGLELLLLVLLSASAGWSFVRPLSSAEHSQGWFACRLTAHVGLAAAIVSWPAAHPVEPFASAGHGAHLWPAAMACLGVGLSVALPTFLLLLSLDRGGRSGLAPFLAPCGAWLSGMLALQLHCPILANEHQWLGHFGVLAPILLSWMAVAYRRRASLIQ